MKVKTFYGSFMEVPNVFSYSEMITYIEIHRLPIAHEMDDRMVLIGKGFL